MAEQERLERLANLFFLLLDTGQPLSLAEIADRLPGYEGETGRQLFERDKAALADQGVVIERVVLSGHRAGATGYRIDERNNVLPDLGLTADERRALAIALTTVRLGDAARDALLKLGGSRPAGPALLELPRPPALDPLYDAIRHKAVVTFSYRDRARELEPYGLVTRDGFWYLVGLERGSSTQKVFRVDRVEGPVGVGPPDGFVPPDVDLRHALPDDFKTLGDEPVVARVLLDPVVAPGVVAELGEAAVVERRAGPEGTAVVVDVPATNLPVFRSWLLSLLEHAEVLGPPPLRAGVVEWLRAVAGEAS